MGKHRAVSHSLRARTVIGGVLASGALLAVGAPAGTALAGPMQLQQHQELDKRIIAGIQNSHVGKAIQAHLTKEILAGNKRDLKFATALAHLLATAP